MTSYTPFQVLHYLNAFVPVWGESSKTRDQQLATTSYLVYAQLREAGGALNSQDHATPSLHKQMLNKRAVYEVEVWFHVTFEQKEVLYWFPFALNRRRQVSSAVGW